MAVYLDLVMILNFLVDYLLLLGTNRLSGFPPAGGRCALAAAVGAVYSGCCLLPGFRFLGNILWRTVSLGLLCTVAFGWGPSALRRAGVFVILSMALGGIAMQFGKGAFVPLLGCGGVLLALCRLGFADGIGGRQYVPVTVCSGERTVRAVALVDTGNTLRDPVTGEQVLVLSGPLAEELTGLSPMELREPFETVASRPVSGLRLIPYHAVGSGGMLLARRFEHVKIGDKVRSGVVAFAPEDFGRGEVYQALTGGFL